MRDTLLRRFEARINRAENGCWLWTGSIQRSGYGQIIIEKGRPNYTHRVAWELYRGHIPLGMYVCHRCDVRACVNPDHLFLGTQSDNMADCVTKDRQAKGAQLPHAKFTDADILDICASDLPDRQEAKRRGVNREVIRDIRLCKTYKHVQRPQRERVLVRKRKKRL